MSGLHLSVIADIREAPTGADTLIFVVPPHWYAEIEGKRALRLPVASRSLRAVAQQFAEKNGEKLHHAVFVLTSDAGEVRAHAPMHVCPSCQAGVDQAVAMLADPKNAGLELAVGQLFWG